MLLWTQAGMFDIGYVGEDRSESGCTFAYLLTFHHSFMINVEPRASVYLK